MEAEFLELEQALLRPDANALIADEFREFGTSGRIWDKAAVLSAQLPEAVEIEHFEVRQLASEVVLVNYQAIKAGRRSLRSSVWIRREHRWKIIFHQGTPVALSNS